MDRLSLKFGEGKYQVNLHAQFCGRDLSLSIFGGEVPHIGAVAVAVPRKSLKEDGSNSASASVICITGHKEDEMARSIALLLSSKWMCNVTVSAGIHIDEATSDDINILGQNTKKLVNKFIEKVNKQNL